MFKISFRRTDPAAAHAALLEAYPFTGTCPVNERAGDGRFVGQCCHATYGGYCPRHGNLNGRLVVKNPTGGLDKFERIDENLLPPHAERDMAPEEIFFRNSVPS